MDKSAQIFLFQKRKPKVNAYRAIRGDGLDDAEKFASDVLANYHIPTSVNIKALRRQADKSGEFILVECSIQSESGMFNAFHIPFRIRKGKLMPPSVVSHDNLGVRVLAQSTFDDIFKRNVSLPVVRHVPFDNSGGTFNLHDLFKLFASKDDEELVTGKKGKMKVDCSCTNTILKKGDEVFIEGIDPVNEDYLIVFCPKKNARYKVLKEKVLVTR